ncbi:MAG: helix-turn-helix domain-containing protein [Treponema sp.]|nr:helix-turn-helix domain-containing protein [Treponema sp.]
MFGVLIVDDEEPVLDSYEFMLNTFSERNLSENAYSESKDKPFTLAGKARTGYEALKLIHEKQPDLVFMDINIPGIDGLSVLEDIYKKYPRMVCVLSTAYERFDLAKRAIPLGVFAYLVKPVSKKTFFDTLENALSQLRSLPPEISEYSEPRLALFRRDIWKPMDEQCWLWYREKLSLPSDFGLAFMVELDQNMEIWGTRIAEQLSFKHHCSYDIILKRGLFLISEDLNADVFRQKTEKILEDLLNGLNWCFGLGGLYRGPLLYRSCSEALAELTAKRQETDAWSMVSKKISFLRQKIGLLPLEEVKALFASVWEPLFAEDFNNAKLRMISVFTLLLDDLYGTLSVRNSLSKNFSGASLPFDPVEIMTLPDLGSWKRWAEINFDKVVLQANLERQGNYPLPLVKAITFIRENYTRGIRLNNTAEAASVNPAHLSRLFSEHLKTNFIDYLTTLRINEAERLLKEKSITVKEAAFAVGYQDPNYFSKAFKKLKGILPTEVRGQE